MFTFNPFSGSFDYSVKDTDTIPAHNTTTSKQGGTTDEYYHLTSAQHTIATQTATGARNGVLSSTDWTTFNGKESALTFDGTSLIRSGNNVSAVQDIRTTATPRFKNLLDHFRYYRAQNNGLCYVGGTTLTGGTYTNGFLEGGATCNSDAASYAAMSAITVITRFRCDDPTQGYSPIMRISDSTKAPPALNRTYWLLGINDSSGDVNDYDYLNFYVYSNGSPVIRWHSTAQYNNNSTNWVAIRCDANGLSIIINGQTDAGTFVTGNASTLCAPNIISGADGVAFGSAKVDISDLQIFNRGLSDYEIMKAMDETAVTPLFANLINLDRIGFAGAIDTNAFIKFEPAWEGIAYSSPPRGLIEYNQDADKSTSGAWTNGLIYLSSYRLDYANNYFINIEYSTGVASNYGLRIIGTGSGDIQTMDCMYLSCDNSSYGAGAIERAIYFNKGDSYYANNNYGPNFKNIAKMYFDGTDTCLNTAISGSGKLKFVASGNFSAGGAQTGTLTNAPSAGNPATWLTIKDNSGNTRYIPCWA